MDSKDVIERLIAKSNEAFILAIELFNKPTISYRVEAFSFLICNAWELLLKARIAEKDGLESIYFDNNPDRTLSIENCIRKVFTNSKDPLRLNLEKIIDLRNTCTHYIIEEYEQIYAPLFQAAVFNYGDKLMDFFGKDITEKISANFLTLAVKISEPDPVKIQARYPESVSEKLLDVLSQIKRSTCKIADERFAISIQHDFYLTKNRKTAAAEIAITKDADTAALLINDPKDMQKVCPYATKKFIELINRWIKRDRLNFVNPKAHDKNKCHKFNSACFNAFVNFFGMKDNPKYCYKYGVMSSPIYSYSEAALQFVYNEIKNDPENVMRILYEKIKTPTPGAKEF